MVGAAMVRVPAAMDAGGIRPGALRRAVGCAGPARPDGGSAPGWRGVTQDGT